MPESRLYLMAELDGDSQRALQGYYSLVRAVSGAGDILPTIPYHVTLGDFGAEEEDAAVALMRRVLPGCKRLTLRLNHIGIFGEGVLFIAPNANVELFELVRGFFPEACTGSHAFVPHVTLYSGRAEDTFRAARALAGAFTPRNACLTAISLYRFPPSEFIRRTELAKV